MLCSNPENQQTNLQAESSCARPKRLSSHVNLGARPASVRARSSHSKPPLKSEDSQPQEPPPSQDCVRFCYFCFLVTCLQRLLELLQWNSFRKALDSPSYAYRCNRWRRLMASGCWMRACRTCSSLAEGRPSCASRAASSGPCPSGMPSMFAAGLYCLRR